MNKTAQEMFEELGYHKEKKIVGGYISYFCCDYEIMFDLNEKEYSASEITIELHKAITQQMKELGWLDENN